MRVGYLEYSVECMMMRTSLVSDSSSGCKGFLRSFPEA
jgi:hypothetical protein